MLGMLYWIGGAKMAFTALDTSQNSAKLVACLRDSGITAIGRYYTKKRTNSKILTADEARRLSDAGVRIWVVYQNWHRQPVDFSSVKGDREAKDALDYATNVINQPKGTAIYFSADLDVKVKVNLILLFDHISQPSPRPLRRRANRIELGSTVREPYVRACSTPVWCNLLGCRNQVDSEAHQNSRHLAAGTFFKRSR